MLESMSLTSSPDLMPILQLKKQQEVGIQICKDLSLEMELLIGNMMVHLPISICPITLASLTLLCITTLCKTVIFQTTILIMEPLCQLNARHGWLSLAMSTQLVLTFMMYLENVTQHHLNLKCTVLTITITIQLVLNSRTS